jgi:peptidoglycan L-alanyl-D-glutamate endopeptidase CwlK
MQITEMIEAVQRKLGVQVDGKAGPETWGAIYAALVKPTVSGVSPHLATSRVDDRSERNIAALLPEVQPIARALVQKAAANGIAIKIISGLRSYAEQDALYAKGRTAPGPKVTNARGGYSNHNFGIAFDVGVFSGNSYVPESPKYKAVGVLGMDLGLEWGGNWTSNVDQPHFQLRPIWAAGMRERDMLAEFRRRVADGEPLFT